MVPLSDLDSLIASRSLLLHPFYRRWSKGELTLEDLRVYAKEYFHLVRRVPGIVSRVRDRAEDPVLRSRIEQNITEEQEHVELWKRFAKSVGVSEDELTGYHPSAKVQAAVSTLEMLAEESLEDGMVTMYAMELELPKIAQTKKDGLCKFYDLTSEDAHIYFDEHLGEEKHLEVWRTRLVDGECGGAAAQLSLTAQNQVLDAVCEQCGIELHC